MKISQLTPEEKALITDPADIPVLEVIKGMSLEEMTEFSQYIPMSLRHYNSIQMEWLRKERYLIAHRENQCRDISDVSELELLEDLKKNHNAERFRVWYVLKFPHMVKR